jgi:D-hexose-6-phosphate mutarotase
MIMNTSIPETLKEHEITGAVAISAGHGKLPRLVITTPFSKAEIYLHGAHVAAFQKKNEPPLLWMSKESLFVPGKAIRGGVPICFPWFGSRAGFPAHGSARLTDWHLAATSAAPDGRVTVRLRLPELGPEAAYQGQVEYTVTVGETLTMELEVVNHSSEPLTFEECLHSYFTVGDIKAVSIRGLHGVHYMDHAGGGLTRKTDDDDVIRFNSEVDRVYLDSTGTVEIVDPKLGRIIKVEKSGSASTVVWNPWVAKSKAMPDFGDEEYQGMVCVESGNVAVSKTTLAPGSANKLKVVLSSQPG